MKNTLKSLFAGVIIWAIVTGASVYAISGEVQKTLSYKNIRIFLDNKKVNTRDINGNTVEPFIIDGTTYLPVRAIGEAFGKEVSWDGNTNTVYIEGKNVGEKTAGNYMDAFAVNIKDVINEYGMYFKKGNYGDSSGVGGLKYGTLIDFERDSIPELVLIHDGLVLVYRFDGEKSSKIYEKEIGSFGNTDVSLGLPINETAEKPYIFTDWSTDGCTDSTKYVFTISDGKPSVEIVYGDCYGHEENIVDFPSEEYFTHFKINEKEVTREEYMKRINEIYSGCKWIEAMYYTEEWNDISSVDFIIASKTELNTFLEKFKKTDTNAVIGEVQKTLHYKDIQIFLDGKKVNTQDINGNTVEPFIIDGTTYLPVRAIGEAFGKEVSWDGNTNIIYIGERVINNYNNMGYVNITGRTIAEVAEGEGMDLSEFLDKYELPKDMPGDTSELAAYYMMPTKAIAKMYGTTFDKLKELLGMGDDITEDTPWGVAEGEVTIEKYIGTENFDSFKEEYGFGEEITLKTKWKEVRNVIANENKRKYEQKKMAQ